jgi:hypothetical protein
MEMLTKPVYCQDNFYFCTATPRPGQHLLQQSKLRTDSRKGMLQWKAKFHAGGSVPGVLAKGFHLLTFDL